MAVSDISSPGDGEGMRGAGGASGLDPSAWGVSGRKILFRNVRRLGSGRLKVLMEDSGRSLVSLRY